MLKIKMPEFEKLQLGPIYVGAIGDRCGCLIYQTEVVAAEALGLSWESRDDRETAKDDEDLHVLATKIQYKLMDELGEKGYCRLTNTDNENRNDERVEAYDALRKVLAKMEMLEVEEVEYA